MNYNRVLVTGGSGLVGKSLRDIIPDAIYISGDDYDLREKDQVVRMLFEHNPTTIIHLAARVGGIVDNINKPAEYFVDNVLMNTILMEEARKWGIKRFIGILSTCIYPDVVDVYPMMEDILHQGPPTPTNFSYGYAKRCMEVQMEAYKKQYGLNYQCLTPCNLYGEYDKWGENSHFIAAMIKRVIKAKEEGKESIMLFGTGKPLRQFMHAGDLAKVIKTCIDRDIYDTMNVATEENLSIHQMAEIVLEGCDAKHLKIEYDNTKPDGQYRKDVSIEKLKRLIPDFEYTPLLEGIQKTYERITQI
jgi:GDP-L-fucose synthase